jgi:hypothetical protein
MHHMGKNLKNDLFLNKKRHQILSVLPEDTLDDIGLRLETLPQKFLDGFHNNSVCQSHLCKQTKIYFT